MRLSGNVVLVLLVSFSLGSCSPANDPSLSGPLPPPPATLRVAMTEFTFVYSNRVPAGRVVFDVTNAGQQIHRLGLFEAPQPPPPADNEPRPTPAASSLTLIQAMPALEPGDNGRFAVDLEPGARYVIASLAVGPDGMADVQRGMTSEFRAGGRAAR